MIRARALSGFQFPRKREISKVYDWIIKFNKSNPKIKFEDEFNSIQRLHKSNQSHQSCPGSWTTAKITIKIRDEATINVGEKGCLLKREERAKLVITSSGVTIYNKKCECSLYSFEAEFVEIKEASITGDALSTKHLYDERVSLELCDHTCGWTPSTV